MTTAARAAAPAPSVTAATTTSASMPWTAHLDEARRRAVRAAVALAVAVVVGFVLSEHVIDVLRVPVDRLAQSRDASLNYDTVTGAFDLRLRIAIVTGTVLSSPVWLHQLLAFVTPGLTGRERRLVRGFGATSIPLFAAGCAFGAWIFPHMVQVLAGFSSDKDSTILSAGYYLDFVLKIVVATGVAFVLPVVLVALNVLGLVSARTLRGGWRVIVVVITLFSALVTPAADVLSMFLVAAPMTLLFAAALGVAHLHDRRAERRSLALSPDPGATCSA